MSRSRSTSRGRGRRPNPVPVVPSSRSQAPSVESSISRSASRVPSSTTSGPMLSARDSAVDQFIRSSGRALGAYQDTSADPTPTDMSERPTRKLRTRLAPIVRNRSDKVYTHVGKFPTARVWHAVEDLVSIHI